MHLVLIGLNHRTAPLELRERVSFTGDEVGPALGDLRRLIGEAVLLSTCNRAEVYCVAPNPHEAWERVLGFLEGRGGLPAQELRRHAYQKADAEVVRHLFRVAGGLDSMLLGESEVLGQVRRSMSAAAAAGSLGLALSRLFHGAIRAGRRVREETEVGRRALSVSTAGVQLASRVLGDLRGRRAALIGAGEAGRLVAKALRIVGVADLAIANRSPARAQALARNLGGRVVALEDLPALLEGADVIISATDAPEYVISREAVAQAVALRHRPLFIFDLAVPRDVDPQVGELEGVRLFNIDHLSAIAEENLARRRQEAAKAEAIVEQEVARFLRWWDSREALPIVRQLHRRAEETRRRELERALRRLGDLPPQERRVLEAMTRSIVKRLLHDPTLALKRHPSKAYLQAARLLFDLPEE